MNKKNLKMSALLIMSWLPAMVTQAQSAYSNAVMSLSPVAYWPLQETVPPPNYDVETNYGSLGPIANAYYASTNAWHNQAGAIAGDNDAAAYFSGAGGSFGIVPTTDHRVSLSPGQPFTVEFWCQPTTGQSYRGIVTQTGPNNAGGLNGSTNSSGYSFNIGFAPYRGTASGNSPSVWDFHVFNGVGFTGGAEADVPNNQGWLNGTANDSWVYFAGVFDGTNCWLYVYSTNLDNVDYGGTNGMSLGGLQLPITTAPGAPVGGPLPGSMYITNAQFSPDTWDPIMFGCTRGLGGNELIGYLDEVAVYTNALTITQITNHFAAGTNGLGNYSATVLADNPYMYWRMDAPKWTPPPVSSYPAAMNYGSAASSMTNLNTGGSGANAGVYQPGTVPGVPGPSYPGFGVFTNACAFNGLVGAVDAGYNSLLDPTDVTNNFTVVAWFKENPGDYNRWEAFLSHSDKSWKAQLNSGTTYGYRGTGSQVNIGRTTDNANDGQWHMYVLEATYANGVSTNLTIYLDNGLVSTTITNTGATPGRTNLDAWIGGAPDYMQPTNEASYTGGQQYFPGKVCHVAYFTNALTVAQIQSLYDSLSVPPAITRQPVSATIAEGGGFTDPAGAGVGSLPLSYQWYKDNARLAGQTNANLVLNPAHLSDQSTNYFLVVTNNYGAATSMVVSLTVSTTIGFDTVFPLTYTNVMTLYGATSVGGTNYLGSSPSFSAHAHGALPILYQWLTNGVAMGGATNTNFTFPNCPLGGPTNFACVVSNSYGKLTNAWGAVYLPATMAPFPQAVLAAQPVAYWRLNEPDDTLNDGNPGAIANDYQSGNNGLYTNVILGNAGYKPLTDPTETAAQFQTLQAGSPSMASWVGTNMDFSAPAGSNVAFSVAVWANGNSQGQPGNAGLVTKGAWAGEQFTLDEGAANSALRFTVRNASGANYYSANSSVQLNLDSAWHFVVGVCDEPHGQLLLYIDGQLAGSTTLPAGSGILSTTEPLTIGMRKNSSGSPIQFWGFLNDVAIYNYALSSNEIVYQYLVSGVGPSMTLQPPTTTNANSGGTLVVAVAANGTPPLSYQWYDGGTGLPITGQTNATLVLNNLTSSDSYYVTVTNAYGSVTSSSVSVTVVSGMPQIYTDVQNPFSGFLGQNAVNSVLAYGTAPLTYQWQFYNGSTWVNLSDNGRISGSQSNTLTIDNVSATDAGNYQVVVHNTAGTATSSTATLTVFGLPLSFYGDGPLWAANGSARINNGVLSLTDPNNGGGDGSFFFQYPQYIGAFQAAFTYQAGGNMTADGVTFCLQNDPLGPTVLGGGGGQLGVGTGGSGPISPSAELEMNIYTPYTMGYAFDTNGLIGPNTAPGSVLFNSGDPINVTVTYARGQAAVSFVDSNAVPNPASYSTTLNVGDLTKVLGADSAYVGFTGSYGGSTSVQTITNFSFVSIPPQFIQVVGTNAVVTWPGTVAGFVLQHNSDLTTTNWVDVTNADNLVNGQHQVVEPLRNSPLFYRLILRQ